MLRWQPGWMPSARAKPGSDMGQAPAGDSAAVAILLAWRRAAAQQGAALSFSNFPPTLHSLAELYGVAGMLHA